MSFWRTYNWFLFIWLDYLDSVIIYITSLISFKCIFSVGLDTFTARHIVETLKDLSEKYNKTVVMSIHQPRYDIFGLVDDVILLSKGIIWILMIIIIVTKQGKQVWAGDKSLLLQALNSIGFSCPELVNPADFILDISSIDVSKNLFSQ